VEIIATLTALADMSPYLLLLILIGSAFGAAFHAWQGKTSKDIFYYIVAGIFGFGLGQILANLFGWQLALIGPLHIIEASLSCWLILFLARWLRV
jgi:hypothetical protein